MSFGIDLDAPKKDFLLLTLGLTRAELVQALDSLPIQWKATKLRKTLTKKSVTENKAANNDKDNKNIFARVRSTLRGSR